MPQSLQERGQQVLERTQALEKRGERILAAQPTTPGSITPFVSDAPPIPEPSFGRKVMDVVADVAPMAIGAGAGVVAGSPAGPPGMIVGGFLGGGGGEALSQLSRRGVEAATGVETFGSPLPETGTEAARRMLEAGTFGVLGEAPRIYNALRAMGTPAARSAVAGLLPSTRQQRLGSEFKLPLTKAQQTQKPIWSVIEGVLRKTLTGAPPFVRYDARTVVPRLMEAARRIGREIGGRRLDDVEAGQLVQRTLADVRKLASENYEKVVDPILEQAEKMGLVSLTAPIRKKAAELADTLSLGLDEVDKAIGSTEATGAARRLLESFEEMPNVPVGEIKKLRTLLRSFSESGEMGIGKGAISQLTKTVDEVLIATLTPPWRNVPEDVIKLYAGLPNLAQAFRGASTRYRIENDLLTNTILDTIAKSKNPEAIWAIIENAPQTAVRTLRRVARDEPGVMADIQRKLWDRVVGRSAPKGVLVEDALEAQLAKFGGDEHSRAAVMNAIWGRQPGMVNKIKRFVELTEVLSLKSTATRPMSAQAQSLLALGQTGLIGGAVVGLATSALTGNIPTFVISAIGLGAITLAPAQLARMLTSPKYTELLIKAGGVPGNTAAGRQLALRIAAAAGLSFTREGGPEMLRSAPTVIPEPVEIVEPPSTIIPEQVLGLTNQPAQ